MSQVLVVEEHNLIQAEDNLTWIVGTNHIIFAQPFADTDYTFEAQSHTSGVLVVPQNNTKTPFGIDIVVSGGVATDGYWEAIGEGSDFSSLESPSSSVTEEQTGFGVATIAGTQILFKTPFSTPLSVNKYALFLTPPGVDYISPAGVDSRDQNGFIAYSAVDNVSFAYHAKKGN